MTDRGEITAGRHAAADGAGVHPLVAAALQLRPTSAEPGTPRHLSSAPRAGEERQGDLGWPGEPGDGTGLGWPAGTGSTDAAAGEQPGAGSRSAPRKLGWRRFFGGGSAAPASAVAARDGSAA